MTDKPIIIDGIKFTENFDIICQTCTRNNPCFQQCNQVYKEIIKYLFNNLQRKTAECEELKARVETLRVENNRLTGEVCDIRNYAGSLQNKLQIATEALEIIANQNFKYTSENICNLAQNEQIPCSNNCKYCFQQYAQHALEQIEGILNEK